MRAELLDILRCPYCGGRLELVSSIFNRTSSGGDTIADGVLACECCVFPVVDGIPVLHLHDTAVKAREHIESQRPELALRAMVGADDPVRAEAFEAAAGSSASTYREIVESLGPNFEGGYFLYRFSDPTFVVADAVVRAVAGTVLQGNGRALDMCGGSGHLTRTLARASAHPPVLADLFFPKIWLARRFTAPTAIPVCCDANSALPFARGSFDYVMCADAFMFIWTKRPFVGEMFRTVAGSPRSTVVIVHTHNQLVWSPSHGQALTVRGYRNLFETAEPRVFGESQLFEDVVNGRALDLGCAEDPSALEQEAAFTFIASPVSAVFSAHALDARLESGGRWRLNPLYQVQECGGAVEGTLHFPSPDYEDEYGACRRYLPETIRIEASALRALGSGAPPASIRGGADLVRRRVLVDLPERYY
jgi:uncharacterized protein YbaR (Trm112 family)/SAM-dependent methyltransferase